MGPRFMSRTSRASVVYGGDYPNDLARPQCQTALGLAQFLEEAGVVLDHHHRLES